MPLSAEETEELSVLCKTHTVYITQSCIGVSLEFFVRLWSKDNYSYNIKLSLQLFIVSPFPLALDLVKFLVAQDAVR